MHLVMAARRPANRQSVPKLGLCLAGLLVLCVGWATPRSVLAQPVGNVTPTADGAAADAATAASAPAAGVDLKGIERRIQTALDKVMPSVVAVSGGSGVVVSEDGYVLTVAHVGMRAGRRVTLTFPNGTSVRGTTLGNDRGVDAGLVKIEGNGPWPYANMGKSSDVEEGQWCVALGYPVSFERGKPPVVRVGRVLSSRSAMLVTDCTIMGGDSGGPVFDLDGNVIAVSSRCDDRLTTNIHVPVDCYQKEWDRLVAREDFNSLARTITYLGVDRDEFSQDVRIGRVFDGTAAEKAGIKAGDVILKFDGKELSKYGDLPPLIEKRKPGDEVEIEVKRGDETLTLRAKLGEREE